MFGTQLLTNWWFKVGLCADKCPKKPRNSRVGYLHGFFWSSLWHFRCCGIGRRWLWCQLNPSCWCAGRFPTSWQAKNQEMGDTTREKSDERKLAELPGRVGGSCVRAQAVSQRPAALGSALPDCDMPTPYLHTTRQRSHPVSSNPILPLISTTPIYHSSLIFSQSWQRPVEFPPWPSRGRSAQ